MFTALASLLLNKPVRHDIAMTGEITLRGLVLPIGGLKEKSLAAKSAGIREVIVPKRNEKDLVEIPEEVRSGLRWHFVSSIDEVMQIALGTRAEALAAQRAETAAARDHRRVGAKPKTKQAQPEALPTRRRRRREVTAAGERRG